MNVVGFSKSDDFAATMENAYVICIAPMMSLVHKECSRNTWETIVRENWKNNKSDQEKFIRTLQNVSSVINFGHDVAGNKFVAEMVPLMMNLNKEGHSEKHCKMAARILWQK